MIDRQRRHREGTENMAATKLTKRALMQLEEGLWIASNCMTGAGYPIYVAQVAPLREREAQWIAIRESESNGRGFWIFRTEAELTQWVNQFRQRTRWVMNVDSLTGQGLN